MAYNLLIGMNLFSSLLVPHIISNMYVKKYGTKISGCMRIPITLQSQKGKPPYRTSYFRLSSHVHQSL